MTQLVVLLALVFAIVIAIFAVQNPAPVTVSFLMWQAQGVAVSVLVLISAAFGAAVMLLLGASREVRWRLRHRSLNQQHRAARARVAELEAAQTAAAEAAASAPTAALPSSSSASSSPTEELPARRDA